MEEPMLSLILAALLQGSAPAGAPSTIVNPDWQRLPTAADISKYYPKAALRDDLAGRAILSCTVTVEGRLTGCTADHVTPEGAGFGEAAVATSEVFRMRPMTRDGRPVAGGTVRIPLNFIIPANLRSAAVTARVPEVKGETVELDCRYKDLHLDNCFARGASAGKAMEAALKVAEGVTLPPLPTSRRQGRIVLPLVFTDASATVSAPDLVTTPRWTRRPSPGDVFRAYPDAARKRGVVGNAVVECRMAASGPLSDCAVLTEAPAGAGFGAAALALTPLFRAEEVDGFGLKVENRRIRIPIRFSPGPPPTRGTGR
jgi:TonB family protein